jgi:magnesium-transporting ATPase (P-type)
VLSALTDRGMRVIAVAERECAVGGLPASADEAERELVLCGLLALEDPPRSHVAVDIAACRTAGIRVAMITGDHPMTARAIAEQIGLLGLDAMVVTGDELPPDDRDLGELVDRDGIVLARISPEQKLRIAHVLRTRGHVVAMTGDGVNDGPALQEADIGIAMGRTGTDVAREAADLVLLDDDFSTIVEAIKHGRATFLNVRRFLTYHLTDNVAELMPFIIWALSSGRFPLAIGVLQILALDIGTDTLPAVALGAEPPAKDVLERPPIQGRLFNGLVARRAFGILGPAQALFSMTAFVVSFVAAGWRPGRPFPGGATLVTASGCAFGVIVVGQLANAFACRSTSRPVWRTGSRGNRLLIAAVGIELVVTALFVVIPAVARALGHRAPSAIGWVFVGAAPVVMWLVDGTDKRLRRNRRPRRAT